jgi:hypothetical protein
MGRPVERAASNHASIAYCLRNPRWRLEDSNSQRGHDGPCRQCCGIQPEQGIRPGRGTGVMPYLGPLWGACEHAVISELGGAGHTSDPASHIKPRVVSLTQNHISSSALHQGCCVTGNAPAGPAWDARRHTGYVTDLGGPAKRVEPRQPGSWAAITLRAISAACIVLALLTENTLRWTFLIVAAGTFLFVLMVLRPKGPAAPGALWTSSADLLRGRRCFPGQLCLTTDAVIWIPTKYSRRHGMSEIALPVEDASTIRLKAGTALFSIFVDVCSPGGQVTRFGTHRSGCLRRIPGDQTRAAIAP